MRWITNVFCIIVLAILSLIVACGPDQASLDATVAVGAQQIAAATLEAWPTPSSQPTYTPAPTLTRRPTLTADPSLTPLPTLTALPTCSPWPTLTPYPTYTPSQTPSPTPIPPTPLPTRPPVDLATALWEHIDLTLARINEYKYQIPPIFGDSDLWTGEPKRTSDCADCPVLIASYEVIFTPFEYDVSDAEAKVVQAHDMLLAGLSLLDSGQSEFVGFCREALVTGKQITMGYQKAIELAINMRAARDLLEQAKSLLVSE